MKTWEKVALSVIGGCGVLFLGSCALMTYACSKVGNSVAHSTLPAPSSRPAVPSAPMAPVKPKTAWTYNSETDPMGHGQNLYATVDSSLPIELDFPYQGAQFPHLEIRKKAGKGDLYITVDKGQFHTGYPQGHIEVRFDDEAPFRVNIGEAADGSSNVIFLRSYNTLVPKIMKAKRMRVKADFYSNGSQLMEFPVAGLEWKP